MKKKRLTVKKLKMITPMILSVILLITFVSYWLQNQYYSEKEKLRIELSRLYQKSLHDGEFILYYQHILKPALHYNDTDNIDELQIGTGKIGTEEKRAYVRELKNFVDSVAMYKSLFSMIENDSILPEDLRIERHMDIYRLGYKYQIYPKQYFYYIHQQDSSDSSQQFLEQLFKKEVFAKFPGINIGEQKLANNQHLQYKSEMLKKKKLGILIYMGRNQKAHVLFFFNYFFYLISVILPQIVFAIILIGLSVFALVFAYRSYLSQIKLNMLRSDFVSNITHELKIPVSTAKAALEAILNFGIADDKEKTISYLKMMSLEMNRLDELTSRVLDHSKLESNQHLLHREDTQLGVFLERIVKSTQLFFTDSIKIEYKKPKIEIVASIDRLYMEGVIRNLLENSKKYGGDDVKIKVKLRSTTSYVYVSVIDNGPGIPKEYVHKIFDRFFRIPNDNKHNVKGFGLGLSFASLVMKQHHGSISVKNRPKGGCKFVLKLPRKQT